MSGLRARHYLTGVIWAMGMVAILAWLLTRVEAIRIEHPAAWLPFLITIIAGLYSLTLRCPSCRKCVSIIH
jgi:hypothetical protein